MPLSRWIILIAIIICAAGVTVWLASAVFGGGASPAVLLIALPTCMILALIVRRRPRG